MDVLQSARSAKHALLTARKSLGAEGRTRARLRRAGVELDDSVSVHPTARVSGGVSLGPRTWVNEGAKIDPQTVVGRDVGIAPGAFICTGTHQTGPTARRAGDPVTHGVVIEDGCWIGAHALVLPGVTVGRGCVIEAAAVVREDCQPDGLYAGVPARRVRDLPTA